MQKAAGTSVFVAGLCVALKAQGESVVISVCNPSEPDHYPSEDGVVISINSILTSAQTFDVVHIHGLWTPILHRVLNWANRHGMPVIWSPHGMLAPWAMAHKRWKKILPWYLYQKGDLNRAVLLHATSEMEAGWIRDLGFKQKSVIVPLGTHLPPSVSPRYHELRTILFVGRIYPVKGLASLIKGWSLLPTDIRQGWQVRLVGPDQAGHMDELKRLADRIGVLQDVHFQGPLFGAQLASAYRDADLFVLPSFTENFGGVVVDAMSYGLPVITTKGTPWAELLGSPENVNGKPLTVNNKSLTMSGRQCCETECKQPRTAYGVRRTDFTDNGRCGWWIDIGVEPLAIALHEAMSLTDEQRREMGENGRTLVQRRYTWSAVAEQMKAVYAWILNGGQPPPCVRFL